MKVTFTMEDQNQAWRVYRNRKQLSAHATQAEAMQEQLNEQLKDRSERVYIRGPERIDIDIED